MKSTRPLSSPTVSPRFAFALAVGVGGVATSADAAVVYSGLQNLSISQGFFRQLDLDGSGSNDIKLTNYVFGGGNYQGASVNFSPGRLVGFTAGLSYVSALSTGFAINASSVGSSFSGSMAYGASNPNAQFNNVTNAFIGLSFPNAGNTYYGWIRVDVNNAAGTFVIKDWAYESTSGVGIAAGAGITAVPESSVLGWLTAGTVAGIAALRARRKNRASQA